MGPNTAEVDAWLRAGGIVVAASDRAARAVSSSYNRNRLHEGLNAWNPPNVVDWRTFVCNAWVQRTRDYRLLLNSAQEHTLWTTIVASSDHTNGWLPSPLHRLAMLALRAQELLCSYAPRYLRVLARSAWMQDAGAFSEWMISFDERCRDEGLLSASRVPLELMGLLNSEKEARPPLMLAAFDRLLPVQRSLFDAWGEWHEISLGEVATDVVSFGAPDWQTEVSACAQWCYHQLASMPDARLLVITQDTGLRRGEIERAFLKHSGLSKKPRFEFSLGVPLSEVRLARASLLLLQWLDGAQPENEIDWLIANGAAHTAEESSALQAYVRTLRRHGLERTRWTLEGFVRQPVREGVLPAAWAERMISAQQHLRIKNQRAQSFLDWAALVPQLLEQMGQTGARQFTSAEFQAAQRWQYAVDLCGSLGFDGRQVSWTEFLSELSRTLDETLFAPESVDAPILIAGPAESAGLTADAIWFSGADEDAWPAGGSAHPLLPIDVQREANMPHASPQLDWRLAASITQRLLASAPVVRFSYARQTEGVEKRPSRLVTQIAPAARSLPDELAPALAGKPLTTAFEDMTRISMKVAAPVVKSTGQLSLFDSPGATTEIVPLEVRGGSNVLTSQSQCAFKAFATARLGAQGWQPAQAGLTPPQRGQLLHAVLHAVWGPPPHGIRTFEQLRDVPDLRLFVANHVQRVLAEKMPACAREQMPQRYLELEEHRLTGVVTEWLKYERTRVPFTVDATEFDAMTTIAGLSLKLRLDRVDRLNDGSLLVVDYKTGNVAPKSWELPRPDDVQLPLYAEFGIDRDKIGGLVFAKIRPGDLCLTGKVRNATATIDNTLKGNNALVKNPLTSQQLDDWKAAIEQLARDFIAGRADVNPREYPKTCERCQLYTLCRVRERDDELEDDDEEANGAEVMDE